MPGETKCPRIIRGNSTDLIHGADSLCPTTEYDTINAITRDDLVAFTRDIPPNNVILGALGEIQLREISDKIRVAQRCSLERLTCPKARDFPRTWGDGLANEGRRKSDEHQDGHVAGAAAMKTILPWWWDCKSGDRFAATGEASE